MLIKYMGGMYSWGESGNVYSGHNAKAKALIDGLNKLGEKEFRKAISSYWRNCYHGINPYIIEFVVAEYRAKSDVTNRMQTRDGTNESQDEGGDINNTVA